MPESEDLRDFRALILESEDVGGGILALHWYSDHRRAKIFEEQSMAIIIRNRRIQLFLLLEYSSSAKNKNFLNEHSLFGHHEHYVRFLMLQLGRGAKLMSL